MSLLFFCELTLQEQQSLASDGVPTVFKKSDL